MISLMISLIVSLIVPIQASAQFHATAPKYLISRKQPVKAGAAAARPHAAQLTGDMPWHDLVMYCSMVHTCSMRLYDVSC